MPPNCNCSMSTASPIEEKAPGGRILPVFYRVAAAVWELTDTVTLELAPERGGTPGFRPGQFNMLYAFGVGEIAISLSGDAGEGERYIHTDSQCGRGEFRPVFACSGCSDRCSRPVRRRLAGR